MGREMDKSGPRLFAAAGPSFVSGVGVAVVKKLIDTLWDISDGAIKKWLKESRTEKGIARLYERMSSVRNVKTLWQYQRELDLSKLYYPLTVEAFDGVSRTVNDLDDLGYEHNIAITGIVGQGKTTLLRHMCYREMMKGQRLAVFYELHQYQPNTGLLEQLSDVLQSMGFDYADKEVFHFLAKHGRLCLFLDGLDEANRNLQSSIIWEVHALARRYRNLQMIVSSRPNTGISHSPFFRCFPIAALQPHEVINLLGCLAACGELPENVAKNISSLAASLRQAPEELKAFLCTPLMVTLLAFVYKDDKSVEEQLPCFFDELFIVATDRHDRTKSGFVRERRSKLNDRQLQSLLSIFCYIVKKTCRKCRFDKLRLLNLVKDAIDEYNKVFSGTSHHLNVDESAFMDDIVEVTGFVYQDADARYHFAHNFICEYYAAVFISHLPDAHKRVFYKHMINERWREWHQTLKFLESLDPIGCSRYFLLPDMEEFFLVLMGTVPTSKEEAAGSADRLMQYIDLHLSNTRWSVAPSIPLGACRTLVLQTEKATEVIRSFLSDDLSLGQLLIELPAHSLNTVEITSASFLHVAPACQHVRNELRRILEDCYVALERNRHTKKELGADLDLVEFSPIHE